MPAFIAKMGISDTIFRMLNVMDIFSISDLNNSSHFKFTICLTFFAVLLATCTCVHDAKFDSELQCNGISGSNTGMCAGRSYAIWREVCCDDGTVVGPGDPSMQCCGQNAFDPRFKSCCNGSLYEEAGLSCCDGITYSPFKATCCLDTVTTGKSEMVSDCCETKAYNPITEVCCLAPAHGSHMDSRIYQRQPDSSCCGTEYFNRNTHLCCGKHLDTKVEKPSEHHSCCGKLSFDKRTNCCTVHTNEILKLTDKRCSSPEGPPPADQQKAQRLRSSISQVSFSQPWRSRGAHWLVNAVNIVSITIPSQGITDLESNSRHHVPCQKHGAHLQRCGVDCMYDPRNESCCINKTSHSGKPYGRDFTCCEGQLTSTPGIFQGRCCGSEGYDPSRQICCGGEVSMKYAEDNQCCGTKPYSVLDQTKLCCEGELHEDLSVQTEAECTGAGICFPKLDTQCESILYPLPGVFCCGYHAYNPVEDLCCAGHSWPQMRGMECCGLHYYDPMNRKHKCCSGRLHRLESGDEGRAQCCGTQLIINASEQECCASSQEQVLYHKEPGFSCCGHFYYNSSQHSCCAGRLRPATAIQPAAAGNSGNCVLETLDNLKNHELCNEEVLIGFVESTAAKSGTRDIVLKNVLLIHAGQNVTALRGTHLLHLNYCGCPSLVKDGLYLFIQQGAKMTTISDLNTSISPVYDILFRCTMPYLGNAAF